MSDINLNPIRDAFLLASTVTDLVGQRDAALTRLEQCEAAAASADVRWQTMVDGLKADLETMRGVIPKGPYRFGGHSPVNVWQGPAGGGEQVCMATTAEWAQRVVAALNVTASGTVAALPVGWAQQIEDVVITSDPAAVVALVGSWLLATLDATVAEDSPEPPLAEDRQAMGDLDCEARVDPPVDPAVATVTVGDLDLVSGRVVDKWGCPNPQRCSHGASAHVFTPGLQTVPCGAAGCGCGRATPEPTSAPVADESAPEEAWADA